MKEAIKKRQRMYEVKLPTKQEEWLIEKIRDQTMEMNINNVTRTKAYLDVYQLYPNIHWAFLGHMVSRNGGWNMTDLKGELLSRLLSEKEKQSFFTFLERGNWLIFQDVYPQFLLYQESLKINQPLFHLFPYFNISIFMEAVWNEFWEHQNEYILAIALIINEQHYLEQRVIQHPLYKKEVLKTLEFKLQDLLSFNQILFPYWSDGMMHVIGQTLHRFGSLHERILLGKRLYKILFQNSDTLRLIERWADAQPHTGSRKDYWPNVFNNIHEGLPGKSYQLRLKSCMLKPGATRIYSPALEHVWKNVKQPDAEKGDWFKDFHVFHYFAELEEEINGEIFNEYCKTLERLELAALAKKAISL